MINCPERTDHRGKLQGDIVLHIQESLIDPSHGCLPGTRSPLRLWCSSYHHNHCDVLHTPQKQYTVVAYIQYNQDWIRKIQLQNDYIQEDSTSTKGCYNHLGN